MLLTFNTLKQDFQLLNKQLTASRLVEILFKDGSSLHDSRDTNLELEVCMEKNISELIAVGTIKITSKKFCRYCLTY